MLVRLLIASLFLHFSCNLLQADPAAGQVKSVSGKALLVTPEGKSEPLTSAMTIPPGSKILTNDNSDVIIEWMPGAFSILFSNTDVAVTSLDYSKPADGTAKRKVALGLTKGALFSHLAHHTGTSDFRIKTPEGVAAARGTDWVVRRDGHVVTVSVLADMVAAILRSGNVVTVEALYSYVMGGAPPARLTEHELHSFLQDLQNAGLSVVLQDINDTTHPTFQGTTTSGYIVTYAPPTGEGFQFFITRWVGPRDDHQTPPLGEQPFPSGQFPPASN